MIEPGVGEHRGEYASRGGAPQRRLRPAVAPVSEPGRAPTAEGIRGQIRGPRRQLRPGTSAAATNAGGHRTFGFPSSSASQFSMYTALVPLPPPTSRVIANRPSGPTSCCWRFLARR
jgi:hypothetical protein